MCVATVHTCMNNWSTVAKCVL